MSVDWQSLRDLEDIVREAVSGAPSVEAVRRTLKAKLPGATITATEYGWNNIQVDIRPPQCQLSLELNFRR